MAETISYKRKSRVLGFFFTSLVSGGIVLILLLIILRTPIPPFPEGGGGAGDGIELNLGFSDAGMGNNPQELSAASEITPPQPDTKVQADEKIMTQDVEDAPTINEKPEKTKKVKKIVPKVVVETPKKVVKKEPVKPQPVVNTKALYTKKNITSADGTSNKAGDQGDPNGTLASKAFGGKGGKGGSGGGTGGGNGTGTGPNTGGGISFNLAGRNPMSLPHPEYKQQVEGVVVVEVTVDKDGKVTQAVAGVKGSTTLDDALLDAARKAALKASFDRKPDAPAFQKGTITYKFRLQ
jgi:TonB family protein